LEANRGAATVSADELLDCAQRGKHGVTMLPPVDAPEVWAFGVTYMDSMRERQAESGSPDVYAKVYDADRPESFFKATLDRLQSPFDEVGIRGDSGWDVPEPELAFVTYGGKIVGYTCGNDMSSRTIEGENPLYLPQAKVYDKSAALGPALVSKESIGDAQKLAVTLVIERDGKEAFRGQANTADMKRDCEYLVCWLVRHNSIPDGTSVMTGTGTIPPPEFTLAAGDVVHITIDKIGTLTNTVVVV
jgi:2-dehydro-3-deoxy-D-arabinonate dehydratase